MSRGQINQTFDTASNENKDYTANAQSGFTAAQNDIGTYQSQLAKFAGSNPYVQGGEYSTSQNQVLANTANAGANANAQVLQDAAVHGGANPAQAIAASEQVAQQGQRNLGEAEATANQQRVGAEAGYNEKTLGGYQVVPGMQGNLANEQGELANQDLNTALGAASWHDPAADKWNGAAANTAQAVGSFWGCPARGSLYLMSDGTETVVENLQVGNYLMGIDDEPELVEEIETGSAPILRIETEDGHVLRVSRVHAFALPRGGFVVASRCLGKTIVTAGGSSRIRKVSSDGVETVYNIITGGSHTYRANGLWSLGVGEAERATSMEDWNKIADTMPVEMGVA